MSVSGFSILRKVLLYALWRVTIAQFSIEKKGNLGDSAGGAAYGRRKCEGLTWKISGFEADPHGSAHGEAPPSAMNGWRVKWRFNYF